MKKALILMIFILLASFTYAQVVRVELDESYHITKYFAIDDVSQYFFSTGATPYIEDVRVIGISSSQDYSSNPLLNNVAYIDSIKIGEIQVYVNDTLVDDKVINFCNTNGVCEHTLEFSENAFTCSGDCSPENDGLCSPLDDNICDQDCGSYAEGCFEESLIKKCNDICGEKQTCDGTTIMTENGACCSGECVFDDPCKDYFNGTVCNDQEYCDGKTMNLDEGLCCAYGECKTLEIEDRYENLTLYDDVQVQYEDKIFILGILLLILLLAWYIRKRDLFIFILMIVTLVALILCFTASITGNATKEPIGKQPAYITGYYAALDTDFDRWYDNEDTDGNGLYYCQENERKLYPQFYPNKKLKPGEKPSFYAAVKCQGHGFANFNGVIKQCKYYNIQATKEASEPFCVPINQLTRGPTASGTFPMPKRTLACPQELQFGTWIYLDFGQNFWTGCYICEDRGGAIKVNGGVYHFDVFKGMGIEELNRIPMASSAVASVGCGDNKPSSDYYTKNPTPTTPTPTTPTAPTTPQEPTQPQKNPNAANADIPDEILKGEKLGYYYLNPSVKVENEFGLIPYIVKAAKECSGEKYDCVRETIPNHWHIGESCENDEKPSGSIYKFCVAKSSLDEENGKLVPQQILLKFAVDLDGMMDEAIEEPAAVLPTTPIDTGTSNTLDNSCVIKETDLTSLKQKGTLGIDVSHWESSIDWQSVASEGVKFSFNKATEGTTFIDDTLKIYTLGAKDRGILVGHYHFARPTMNSPEDEANFFVNTISPYLKKDGKTLRPVLDLEDGYQLGGEALTAWVNRFMAKVKERTGITPILYTNINYLKNYLPSDISTKYPIWVANYETSQPSYSSWYFWQYSESGSLKGIPYDAVDLDYFRGNLDCLKSNFLLEGTGSAVSQPKPSTSTTTGTQTQAGFEEAFSGITYGKFVTKNPRPLVYFVTKVDLTNPNIKFLVTPGSQLGQRTSGFLASYVSSGMKVAINGDEHLGTSNPKGRAISQGHEYSPKGVENTLFISADNKAAIGETAPFTAYNAVSGSHRILSSGAITPRIASCAKPEYCNDLHPRTSVGVSQDGKTLIIIVVDGRRPGYSEGLTLTELAQYHLYYGSYDALNLDGGGSTTLVMQGKGILNSPTDPPANADPKTLNNEGVSSDINAYTERTVSNHLGIYSN
ncbi:MAG: phosphodiester glycosidase family protein [Candidatus Woesearchaeota archaeon]|nr:phosphodiester glycosidase family protein [Candidatus Woesearchaeota archaeon]